MARVGDVLAVADAIRTLVGQTPDLGREAAVPVALADLDLTVIERLWSLSPTGGRARARTWNTQHGGIFILLPYLVEAVSTLGGLEPRTGTVTALAGPHACNDPAIQALLGTESKTVSTGAAEGLTDEQHADETIKWLFRSRAIGPVSPRAHRVQVDGCRFTLVIDDLTHHWLGAFKGAANTVATRRIIEQFDPPSHDKLRPRKLSNELRHFTPLEAGLTNTVTAANVMRRMATSLPGFGFTPSTHLWAQALQTSASVAVTADGWEVEVDRSPLAEILRICGHSNRTTFVPWLGNLSVRVVIHR